MLPSASRLRDGPTFRVASRRGRRCGRSGVVVHLLLGMPSDTSSGGKPGAQRSPTSTAWGPGAGGTPQVGLVVGRQVGPAVVRNRVRRRLRHLLRDRLEELPERSVLVVRALPPAGSMTSSELADEVDACLRRLVPKS